MGFQNTSGIKPTQYNVVVQPKAVEEKTAGGLFIPEEVKEKEQFAAASGVLVSVSPICFEFEGWPADNPKPKPGDQVIYRKYAGVPQEGVDGNDYRIMKDEDIVAVIVTEVA